MAVKDWTSFKLVIQTELYVDDLGLSNQKIIMTTKVQEFVW